MRKNFAYLIIGLLIIAGLVGQLTEGRTVQLLVPGPGSNAVIANRVSGTISVISAISDEVVGTYDLPVGDYFPEPMYVVYTAAMNRVFVGDRANNRVVAFNATDFSGYPDCRHEYVQAFENLANLATVAGTQQKNRLKFHTPIINMTKVQTILAGMKLGVDYSLTHSCYDPDETGKSCRTYGSCRLRLKGFAEAGLKDPIEYQNREHSV